MVKDFKDRKTSMFCIYKLEKRTSKMQKLVIYLRYRLLPNVQNAKFQNKIFKYYNI